MEIGANAETDCGAEGKRKHHSQPLNDSQYDMVTGSESILRVKSGSRRQGLLWLYLVLSGVLQKESEGAMAAHGMPHDGSSGGVKGREVGEQFWEL